MTATGSDATREEDGQPFRRRVFYIPGYDPFPPRRYRELYRREAALQAAVSGYGVAVRPRDGKAGYGWHVAAVMDGRRVETEVEVLVWSDLVQSSMAQGILATYGQLLRTAWVYLRSGALVRLMRLRKGPVIAALYPVAMLVAQLAVALAVAALAWRGVLWAMPELDGLGLVVPAVMAFVAARGVLAGFRRLDHRLFAYYLMHDYAHTAQADGAYPADLLARMELFRARIAAALAEGWDEVLVVGHSSGAHLGVSILAGLVRERPAAPGPALGFLTLGQVVPMVSFLPGATQLRADLHDLSASPALTWVDVTAPGDGCAFALCDPVAVTGVAPRDRRWPLVISAAFTQTLSPARWKALRWRFFRLHFQYLCAFDRPGDYDYFRITAGPLTLAQRFAGRAPSKSRIETPLSPHQGRAA